MTFGRGYYYCKNINFFQNVGKNNLLTLKVHDRNEKDSICPDSLFFMEQSI